MYFYICKKGIIEGMAISKAAAVSQRKYESDTFQHVAGVRDSEGNMRPYSRGAAVRKFYDDWRTKYCVETSNGGLAKNIPGCGSARKGSGDEYKMNLDLHIADILFNPGTYPEEDIVDAKKTIAFYFGAKPLAPIAPRDYKNPETQSDIVTMRKLAAKRILRILFLKTWHPCVFLQFLRTAQKTFWQPTSLRLPNFTKVLSGKWGRRSAFPNGLIFS